VLRLSSVGARFARKKKGRRPESETLLENRPLMAH
jgi:hypothetical protein